MNMILRWWSRQLCQRSSPLRFRGLVVKFIGAILFVSALVYMAGCAAKEDSRIKSIKSSIHDLYEAGSEGATLVIDRYGQNKISAFCVLAAYEDQVVGDTGLEVQVNQHLRSIGYQGVEEYWALLLLVDGVVVILRNDVDELPLVYPRPSFSGGNCVSAEKIIVTTAYQDFSARGVKDLRVSLKEEI